MNQRRHRVFLVLATAVFVVAAVVQIGLSLRHPRWFKGNIHAHSNRNEGDVPPAEVARWYRERDYQFLALSDHNVMTDPSALAEAVPGRFLVLNATELSGHAAIHVNAIAPARLVAARPGVSRRGFLFDNVDAVRASSGVPVVNHPRHAELTFSELMHLDGPFLLEIHEGSAEALWDQLLTAGRDVFGVASDDARYFRGGRETQIPGTGWVAVRSTALDSAAIAQAMREGHFYASTGVVIDDVGVHGGEVRVAIHGIPGERYKTTFVGADSRVLSETLTNPATYSFRAEDGYVRARVESQDGRAAWTQAIRVRPTAALSATVAVDPNVAREIAAALAPAPLDGPVQRVGPYDGSTVPCDAPPDNNAIAAERQLAARRAMPNGAFQTARADWILTRLPSADLETIAREVRTAYQDVIQAHLPKRTITAVDVRPAVLSYPAGYAGNPAPVDVRVKTIRFATRDERGRTGTLAAYFVNYDRVRQPSRVVLVSTPHVPAEAVLGVGGESVFAGAAGRIAASGVPLILYDSSGTGASSRLEDWDHGLYYLASDIQLLDAALLGTFARVDVVGSVEAIVHLLASHRARLASAYLVQFIPLWTRNDAAPRTGGPFGFNEDADHVGFQTRFQWADFLLTAVRDGVSIAFALNVGASGLSKAGLLNETVPALQRHGAAFQVRGDDPDGDGAGGGRLRVCGGFDPADVEAFLKGDQRR